MICYWRDKRNHEIDFVVARQKDAPVTIECKWTYDSFEPKDLIAFRKHYSEGKNIVVVPNVDRSFSKNYENISVKFVNLPSLIKELEE